MTLRLILIRHAKSDWADASLPDHDRPLNPRGKRVAPLVGQWLASRKDVPGHVLCSDARRTRETLELILPELPEAPPVTFAAALYHASAETLLDHLRREEAHCVMVIGHNPGLAECATRLAYEVPVNPRFGDFPTAAVAVFDFTETSWADVTWGRGTVRDFVVPDDLED